MQPLSKIFYWNCGSGLISKWDIIVDYILRYQIDAFFIAEADLLCSRDLSLFHVPGYKVEFANTLQTRGKTRLICVCREKFQRVENLEVAHNDIICLRLKDNFTVGIYRPFKCFPGETLSSNFDRLIENLYLVTGSLVNGQEITVVGDFNINLLAQSSWGDRLVQWSDDYLFDQYVDGITRSRLVSGKLQTSMIDLVFSNKGNITVSLEFSDLSDHAIIKIDNLNTRPNRLVKTTVTYYDWRKYSPVAINKQFNLHFRGINKKYKSSDSINDYISNCILKSLNILVPKRTATLKGSNAVINPTIQNLRNIKNRKHKLWLASKAPLHWTQFKAASKSLNKSISAERRRILNAGLRGNNKKFWQTTNNVMGKNIRNNLELELNGVQISDDNLLAEEFINFFAEKVEKLQSKTNFVDTVPTFDDSLCFDNLTITPNMVSEMIDDMKGGKAQGFDEIPSMVIKDLKSSLVLPLTWLFNTITLTSIVPKAWKISKITPIHKKGPKKNINNYRPINNISSLSKVFEKCILELLLKYGNDHIFGKNQHGFCRHRSTITAALSLQDFLACRLDEGKAVMLYSADLSAAFDLLRPGKMIEIMRNLGISESLNKLIYNFLTERSALVQVNSSFSSIKHVPIGCVQGSVLGPVLFNIYTSGLGQAVNPEFIVSYADDSYLAVSVPKSNIFSGLWRINQICEDHFDWLSSIGMVYNPTKTDFIIFGRRLTLPKYSNLCVRGSFIDAKKSISVLGIEFESCLSWKNQIYTNIKSANSQLYALRYLNHHLSRPQFKEITHAHFLSRLLFALPVWTRSVDSALAEKLSSCIYKTLRLYCKDYSFRLSRSELISRTNVRNFPSFRIISECTLLHSLVWNNNAGYLTDRLEQQTYRNPRYKGRLTFKGFAKKRPGTQSFVHHAKKVAELIPFPWLEVNPKHFKRKIKFITPLQISSFDPLL